MNGNIARISATQISVMAIAALFARIETVRMWSGGRFMTVVIVPHRRRGSGVCGNRLLCIGFVCCMVERGGAHRPGKQRVIV